MFKALKKYKAGGKLEVFEDIGRRIFVAKPSGIINPSLVKEDLKTAEIFAGKCSGSWRYVTNTEDVILVNPLNLIYLKEIKKLDKIKEIIVYVPNIINRLLLLAASPLIQVDRIITKKNEFNELVKT